MEQQIGTSAAHEFLEIGNFVLTYDKNLADDTSVLSAIRSQSTQASKVIHRGGILSASQEKNTKILNGGN
jgi:hypothetical protein